MKKADSEKVLQAAKELNFDLHIFTTKIDIDPDHKYSTSKRRENGTMGKTIFLNSVVQDSKIY